MIKILKIIKTKTLGKRQTQCIISAVKRGDVQTVKQYLDRGLHPNIINKENQNFSLLHYAAQSKSLEMVKLLIENNADIDPLDLQYGTPLHDAAYYGEGGNIVEYLLQNGANVHAKTVNDRTPLHIAAWNRNVKCTEQLLHGGSEVNCRDKFGNTPLDLASTIEGNAEVIQLLAVKYGAKLHNIPLSQFSPRCNIKRIFRQHAKRWPLDHFMINLECKDTIMALFLVVIKNQGTSWFPFELLHVTAKYIISQWVLDVRK